jgi:hypothetical protein
MQTLYLNKGERNLSSIVGFLSSLPKERAYEVTITERRNTRSIQQCRYLNGVAYKLLSDATGYERDDISEYLCGQYWGWKPKRVPGKKIVQVPLRTTTTNEHGKRSVLSKTEFCDYVAFVQRFGAEHGLFIPDPE